MTHIKKYNIAIYIKYNLFSNILINVIPNFGFKNYEYLNEIQLPKLI